jgi:hypothetical protein
MGDKNFEEKSKKAFQFSDIISFLSTTMASPFEGPEKLLEIWFAPSATHLDDSASPRCGLRKVPSSVWEAMLDMVKCKIISIVHGVEMDAYLLRFAFLSSAK